MLPQDFTKRMELLLGEEYLTFIQSYEQENHHSLRLNTLKRNSDSATDLKEDFPFTLTKVAWAKNGYYYDNNMQPGKHPYHEAGVYYIQEASAMAPVSFLGAQPGERILDLCAAPGGKSTQIAADMEGQGLLVCNEIHPGRAKILSENVERMGITNALVLNETPAKLAERFEEYFDRILVDAPCSGEGMFRKNEDAGNEWSLDNVKLCAQRQDEILDCAADMLRSGGRLVYSTCTFAPEENEGSISRFLERHPDFKIVPVEKAEGMAEGRVDYVSQPAEGIEHTIRLWPHKLRGEGHFLAVLQKEGTLVAEYARGSRYGEERGINPKECKEFFEFLQETLKDNVWEQRMQAGSKILLRFGEQLYLAPGAFPSLQKLKVLRPGLHLGTMKKNRFEPSHALALALSGEEVKKELKLSSKGTEIAAYLNGMTLNAEGESGWHLITVDGYSIGWGKLAGGVMKNHYPKGLRKG